jgi:hypothetical protein
MNKLFLTGFLFMTSILSTRAGETIVVTTNDLCMVFSVSPAGKVMYHYFGNKLADYSAFAGRRSVGRPGVLTTELLHAGHRVTEIDDRLISPYDAGGWASHVYVAKDRREAVLFAFSLQYHNRTTCFRARLDGLDPGKRYRLTELNSRRPAILDDDRIFTGEYLMNVGLSLDIKNQHESVVIRLTEIEKDTMKAIHVILALSCLSSGALGNTTGWFLKYNPATRGVDIEKEGRRLLQGVHASYKLGERTVTTREYRHHETRQERSTLRIVYSEAGLPTLVHSFIVILLLFFTCHSDLLQPFRYVVF